MAEAILKHKSDYEVKSAGMFTGNGASTNDYALEVLKERNIEHEGTSQMITDELVDWADLILTMTNNHKQNLMAQYSNAYDKAYTLKEYANGDHEKTWRKLKKARLDLEEKRAQLIEERGTDWTEEKEREFLKEVVEEIKRLERKLPNLDIPDPYGYDLPEYQKAASEIEQAIDQLLVKLKK